VRRVRCAQLLLLHPEVSHPVLGVLLRMIVRIKSEASTEQQAKRVEFSNAHLA
jgi:hypothetical protein